LSISAISFIVLFGAGEIGHKDRGPFGFSERFDVGVEVGSVEVDNTDGAGIGSGLGGGGRGAGVEGIWGIDVVGAGVGVGAVGVDLGVGGALGNVLTGVDIGGNVGVGIGVGADRISVDAA